MKYKYTKEELEQAVKSSYSFREVGRKLNCQTIPNRIARDIEKLKLDISHFKGQAWNKGLAPKKDDSLRKGIVVSSTRALHYLIPERGHKCERCGLTTWNDQPIPLEVHHIDGDKLNNDRDNLIILCPNCHAQTDNYKRHTSGRNKFISDQEFVEALKTSKNIRQALMKLGLTPKGDNYRRAHQLILEYELLELLEH